MNRITSIAVLLLAVVFATSAFAEPNNTGQSGAPGLQNCASSCHGTGTGTVSLTGFPAEYTPNTTYLIALNHAGGSSIKNFNASCRVGMGTTNAGTITSGYRTITYNVTDETNGIHLSQDDRDSCNFSWTSPGVGTGEVRLYVASHQGGQDSGPNTDIVLVASEGAATPPQCTDPNPPDLATDVQVNVVLSWTGSADVWWYNVFFGTINPPPYIDFQPETEFTPLNVQPNTTYYWKINPANGNGDTEGEIWQFTTIADLVPPVNPNPSDHELVVPIFATLSWDTVTGANAYLVYFGPDTPPDYVATVTEPSFDPAGEMAYETTYYWRVRAASATDTANSVLWDFTTVPSTAADDSPALPTVTTLGAPYPNPFNAETTIPFELSAAQHITLTIYDMTGREVAQLADGEYPAGKYNVKWNSQTTASGVYLVRMTAGNEVYVAKLLALK
jgi:hypothetical protein